MATKRITRRLAIRPRISAVAAQDYRLYCENTFGPEHECEGAKDVDGRCECCAECDAAWWRIYHRHRLRPWFREFPIIFPADTENIEQWAQCLAQALQYVYSTDSSLRVRIAAGEKESA